MFVRLLRELCNPLLVTTRSKSTLPECHFLANGGRMLVCYHPTLPTPRDHTQPLRPADTRILVRNRSLTRDQIELVKKLRKEDEFLWTLSMLSKLLNVEKNVIRQVAPNSDRYDEVITMEREKLAHLRPYKKRLIRAKQELRRKERLRKIIAERQYDFPTQLPD